MSAVAEAEAEAEDARIAASWTEGVGGIPYTLVQAGDFDVVAGALTGCLFAVSHLGIPKPYGRFFREESAGHRAYRAAYGMADWVSFNQSPVHGLAHRATHSIGVHADLDPLYAVEVAAHETFHLTQSDAADPDLREREAEAYGQWAAGVLVQQGRLARVFAIDGYPYSGETLAGTAEQWDVVVCAKGVFRNFDSRMKPRWVPHWQTCPVPTRSRGR